MKAGPDIWIEGEKELFVNMQKHLVTLTDNSRRGLRKAGMSIIADAKSNLRSNGSVVTGMLRARKGLSHEFDFYDRIEHIASELIMKRRKVFKNVCANVDFYSGFVYTMLGIPTELFTPFFAIARISGWSAHRLEELLNANKIIRPAYKYVGYHTEYIPISER